MCMALYSPNGVGGTFVIPRLQPIGDPNLRPPAAGTWQLPIGQPPVTWQPRQHRSTTVNAAGHRRSMTVNAAGHRRSTVAVNDGRRWQITVDCRWTIVDHHRTTGQRWLYLVHQSLAASRRHVAASYWTAAGDVAATSAPVNAGQRRSTPAATGQRRRFTVVIDGQRRRPPVNDGDRRSTVAVNDGRRWRTTVDCRWTTVDHHRTTDQRWLVGWSTTDSGPVWIGSGPGRVWAGSGSCLGRVRVVSGPGPPRVSHVCPRGIHVAADVDIKH
nr:hypothetical protein [Tanacetum cinerariifolium]